MEKPAGSTDPKIRLNKYLSEAGVCSRREADRMIACGEVTVDGITAHTGMKISGRERIIAAGKPVIITGKREIVLAVNKPRGVVCTTDRRWDDKLLIDLIHVPYRVFSVGRLDKESEGLILMTNEGDLLNRIMKSENGHEKEDISSGAWKNDQAMQDHPGGGARIPYDTDAGTEPPDPQNVCCFWLSGDPAPEGADHEHPPGGPSQRAVQRTYTSGVGGTEETAGRLL